MSVSRPDDLIALRDRRGCEHLDLNFSAFVSGQLPIYMFRYAIWALAAGGTATVRAPGTLPTTGIFPFEWTFRMVVQAVAKAIHPEGTITAVDHDQRTITFSRLTPPTAATPWSAIVVFSGSEQEMPALRLCIASLLAQRGVAQGGQLIVCGPSRSGVMVADIDRVEYVSYDADLEAGRVMIARKKNHAIRAARHENVLVCHTRMSFPPNTLDRLPLEFDCITPRVEVCTPSGRRLPYLDLGFIGVLSATAFTTTIRPRLNYDRTRWRRRLARQYAYIDGGLFCVKRSVALATPLHDAVAWGEGEDVEWCIRLQQAGRLVELCEGATTTSNVNRLARYEKYGHRTDFLLASGVLNALKFAAAFLRSKLRTTG